ncbi:MAG: lactate utilization protein B [Planctomycetota bacterium]
MKALRARTAHSLADVERIEHFDGRVWSIRDKRLAAAAKHPHWEELRSRASEIKAHTVNHLDLYLARFIDRARAAGAEIHLAGDGAAANEIIRSLCLAAGATRVTKSKSMTTEECGLNRHLADHGIEVVDTDLGERIVQLLGEPPSHIVAPAIHRRAWEVGQLFERAMGAPAGEKDPARLTAIARSDLRRHFLAAQVGITGVNFAVAETGTVVVVENEANSLLTTSLPDVHIAVMGFDKLIPRLSDLGVFLSLLARSATGQRITSYTSHYTGPQARGEGERDRPPRRLHVVILDNGRSRVLAREHHRSALGCIRCGACMNVCPVYRRVTGHAYSWVYPGPIGSVLAPDMAAAGAGLPFASSLCGACSEVCPVGIDLHQQLILRRARLVEEGRVARPPFRRLAWLFARPRLYRWLERRLRRRRWLTRRLLGRWLHSRNGAPTRELPEPAEESFTEWWRRNRHGREGG